MKAEVPSGATPAPPIVLSYLMSLSGSASHDCDRTWVAHMIVYNITGTTRDRVIVIFLISKVKFRLKMMKFKALGFLNLKLIKRTKKGRPRHGSLYRFLCGLCEESQAVEQNPTEKEKLPSAKTACGDCYERKARPGRRGGNPSEFGPIWEIFLNRQSGSFKIA